MRNNVLLAGRTPALQWAALMLRHAGFNIRTLSPNETSTVDDTITLLIDLDDQDWPQLQDLATDANCPVVLMSAFGRSSAAPTGSDLTVSAAAGLLHVSGTPAAPEGRPAVLIPQQSDALAGSFAALWVGVQALARANSGITELTKLDSLAIATSWAIMQWLYAGEVPSRLGSSAYQPAGVFETKDGAIYAIIVTNEQWHRLVEAMGNPEWASWDVFATTESRRDNVDVITPHFANWVAQHTREELLDLSLRYRLPFALANRPEQAASLQQQLSGENDHANWLYRTTSGPSTNVTYDSAHDPRKPLAGTLVLDLSTVWATPYVGQLLAQLGARVIKIESRRHLDDVRSIPTYRDSHTDGHADWDRSGGFREVNRGKESLELDLTTAEGRSLLHKLVPQADVLLSNLTPGADREHRLGIATEQLWNLHPGLVIGRLSAYEPTSRLAGMTGYGYGMLLMCGYGYSGPNHPWIDRGIAYPDPLASTSLALGVVRALTEREMHGHGSLVEANLFGVSAALMREFETTPESNVAFEDCLPCAHEEWIAISCRTTAEFTKLANVLDTNMHDDTDPTTAFMQKSRAWDAQSLQSVLRQHGVMAERILDVRELARTGRLTGSKMLHIPPSETHLHLASPWQLNNERIDVAARSPWLGEHTAELLEELLDIDAVTRDGLIEREVTW